jgi:DivIVA domain-containing protein
MVVAPLRVRLAIVEWAIALLVVAVLGVAAAIAAGGVGQMSPDPVRDQYRQDLPDTALTAHDLQNVRFGVTLRGYAMDQVDDVLARLSHEIAERDAVIAELQGNGDITELSGTELGGDRARPTTGVASRTGAGEVTR